ncbi:hypothetical protein quinque_009180 [Culex quinquefasciatus]
MYDSAIKLLLPFIEYFTEFKHLTKRTIEKPKYGVPDNNARSCIRNQASARRSISMTCADMVSMAYAMANSENLVVQFVVSPEFELDDVAHMMVITQPKLVLCDANNYDLTIKIVELSVKIKPMIYVFESDMENVNK